MREPGIVFLMYHELESPGHAVSQGDPGYVRYVVRASAFRAQMELLKIEEWRGVSVGEAIGSISNKTLSNKTVAITFDDGSETDLLTAAPILREFGFAATFYITAGWTGRPGHLSSSQLRELASLGLEIGSHSMTHAYLTDLDDFGVHREVAGSKLQLEQTLGKPVEHFSCPGGRFDDRVARIARDAGYRTVSTSRANANDPGTDPFALGRVAVMRHTSLPEFRNLCAGRGLRQWRLGVQLRETTRSVLGNSAYDRLRAALLRFTQNDSNYDRSHK
jgi:peptidoglycan/xylan/chitin deacetylase (PgdA/CDA1 family)